MNIGIKNKDLGFGFVALVAIASIDLWSFKGIEQYAYNAIEAFVLVGIVLIVLTRSGVLMRKGLNFRPYVLLLLVATLPSVAGASLYHNQDIPISLYVVRYSLYWLFYFVLHIFDPGKERILKLMIFIGSVWAALTIGQQFTYPRYWFYSRDDEKKSIYRAGVYRFSVAGLQYGLFLIITFYYRYLTQKRVKDIAWILFGLVGLYYYGTRQHLAAAAGCMCVAVLMLKGVSRWKNLLLIFGVGLIGYGLKQVLFGELIEMTNRQLEYDDDIRIQSARFYFFEYWPDSPWAKLIGNGRAYGETDYGHETELITKGLRFFRSDVGIIGSYNQFGLIYVFIVVAFLIKGMTFKIGDVKERYLKIFFFYSTTLLIINEAFAGAGAPVFYSMLLYMIDKAKASEREADAEETAADVPATPQLAAVPY